MTTHILAIIAAPAAGPILLYTMFLREHLELFLAALFASDFGYVVREGRQTHAPPAEVVHRLLHENPTIGGAAMEAHLLVRVVGIAPLAGKLFGKFWPGTETRRRIEYVSVCFVSVWISAFDGRMVDGGVCGITDDDIYCSIVDYDIVDCGVVDYDIDDWGLVGSGIFDWNFDDWVHDDWFAASLRHVQYHTTNQT